MKSTDLPGLTYRTGSSRGLPGLGMEMNGDHLVAVVIIMAVMMNAAGDIIATSFKAEA